MKYCSNCGAPMGNHDKICDRCQPLGVLGKANRKRKALKRAVLVSTILMFFVGFYPVISGKLPVSFFKTTFLRYELFICFALIVSGVFSLLAYVKECWGFSVFSGLLGPAILLFISWLCGGLFEVSADGFKEWVLLIVTYFLPNVLLIISAGRLLVLGKEGESDYTLHYRRLLKLTINDEQTMV